MSFDPKMFELSPEHLAQNAKARAEALQKVPKPKKRPQHFSRIPMALWEHLSGASRQTLWMAGYIYYMHWKSNGEPFKLSNSGYLKVCKIPSSSKLRALRDLERRGVISIEWRVRKSPIVSVVYYGPIAMGD
jgi:hypothetical protein